MASDKQINYIKSLYDAVVAGSKTANETVKEEIVAFVAEHKQIIAEAIGSGDITGPQANTLITGLKSLSEICAPVSNHARWKKIGDKWAIAGPADIMIEGETVTVKSKSKTQDVVVGRIISSENNIVLAFPEKPKGEAVSEIGFYRKGDAIIEAYNTKKGFLVARTINDDGSKGEYLGKNGLIGLNDKLTLEEAQEFGRKTGRCMICGKELTNPESIADGIGPICSGKAFGV